MTSQWRSYGSIADEYDRIWGERFAEAADFLLVSLALEPGDRLLDVGTGTGVVPRTLKGRGIPVEPIGVDLSLAMLDQARKGIYRFPMAVADAASLPFPNRSFDAVTLNFVLSHLPDCSAGLSEVVRVLRRSGTVAVSTWGPAVHPAEEAWKELLIETVGTETLRRAGEEVAPWESHFADSARLRSAFVGAGLEEIEVKSRPFFVRVPVEDFVADRELSSSGRLARHVLGDEEWTRFRDAAVSRLRRRFGELLTSGREAHVGVGVKAERSPDR